MVTVGRAGLVADAAAVAVVAGAVIAGPAQVDIVFAVVVVGVVGVVMRGFASDVVVRVDVVGTGNLHLFSLRRWVCITVSSV